MPSAPMLDLMRTQNNIRNQQQQQSNNQQFSLGGQQMGGMGGGSANGQQQPQSQPFLDSGSNPQQGNMSPAFTGTGLPSAVPMQQSMSRNAMMQALQANANQAHANPSVARQLELMLAQSQPQNTTLNIQQRMEQHQRQQQQQQQQAQHQQQQQQLNMSQGSSGEMFAPGMADRRSSPAHPNSQGPGAMGGTPQPQPRGLAEFSQRAQVLRANIETQENLMRQLSQQRPPDMQKLRQLQGEIKSKREYLAKMMAALQQMGNASGQQQNWGFNASSSAQLGGHPQAQNQPQPGQNNIQPSPSNMHAQIPGNLLPQGMIVRPPSGQPQPHHQQQQQHTTPGGPGGPPGRPFSTQMSPNMNPQFPFNGNNANGASALSPPIGPPATVSGNIPAPPLEKNRFESAYKNYSATKGVKHEPHLMNVDGRSIDLYILHTQVMLEGGANKVHSMELWNVIGGRMGFVQFPGTDAEPAKSGPGVAQRLAQVYKEYLAGFDQVYINSFIESRIKNANAEARRLAAQQQQQAQEAAQRAAAAASANGGGPSTQMQARHIMNAQQMQMVIGYANQSADELRRAGVQDKIIQFVEQNRAHLQRTVREQGMFRGNFQNQGLRPPEQHGMPMATPFLGGGPHQSAPPTGGQTPQQFMQQRQQNGLLPMQGNNFMDNRQPQLPPQQQQHPQNGNPIVRATKEQAMAFINKTKREFQTNNLPNMRGIEVSLEQRPEFMHLLQDLQHITREIDAKLPMYFFVLKSEESIRKLIAIIMTVGQQGALLNTPNPRYIVAIEILRNMMTQVKSANAAIQSYLASQIRPQGGPQQLLASGGGMPPMPEITRPSSQAIPQQHIPQPQLAPPNRPPPGLRPPQPVMKKASGSTPGATTVAAVSTPTPPAYSASTPVASAATPTHTASSPQAPKSPKSKAPQKPKNPPKRRPSVKNPSAPIPIPAAADQAQTATPSGSVKRPREDDNLLSFGASPVASGSAMNEPSPPKRVKTEWDGPPSDAVQKKAEAVENVKTEEDASAFLEQMTELIKMAGEGQQESLSSDISETLDQILKGYGTVPEGSETLGHSSLGGLGESSIPSSSSSTKPPADEFVEFFDFSSFGTLDDDNDDDSKAPTPELVSSSSTNPSPESGSEADTAHHALLSSTESKTEELPDLLRLGPWKEIDGGESAYYQSGDWKWDSSMPTQEQPWAIFTT
ncbi:hypothetical protein DXG03_004140 [Asterophora parasitica]|uniref:ARID domain-containing protein n=1 Tax=Asterophora parasitica TaxID=117018 RepID=A0A9P7KBI1_9AGAR|nr:hypothetical protein DXG03_004140 [Asterophora parasitica]